MDILFRNVMPYPLSSFEHAKDSIWGKDFTLVKGQKILLNAISGKGKSTFSSTLYGIRSDFDGDLFLGSKSVKKFSVFEWSELRRTKLSIVFQDLQLFPDLTVKENLLLKNNLTNSFSEEDIHQMIIKLGIEDKWYVKCGILSMGQQQRVAIIRSLLQPFEWLILDEPFSHLDEVNSTICLELINERCDQLKTGFILTSLGSAHNFKFDNELKL